MQVKIFFKVLLLAIAFSEISCSDTFIVKGNSMYPTFKDGETVKIRRSFLDLEVDDVIVFYFPFGEYDNKFVINKENLMIKRVVGISGDTVSVVDGRLMNNRKGEIVSVAKADIGSLPYWKREVITNSASYHHDDILHMNSVYIPKQGDTIEITEANYNLYKTIIKSENPIWIEGEGLYTFRNNYYFVSGDNFMYSWDSRQWGFLPQQYIIGKVTKKHK